MAIRSVNTQSINVTILDDNIVEDFEFVGLRLTTEDPDIISVDQDVARIEISDNDGMIHSMQLYSQYNIICVQVFISLLTL